MVKKNCFALLAGVLLCTPLMYGQKATGSTVPTSLHSYIKIHGGIIDGYYGLEWEQKISAVSSISFFGGISRGFQADGFSNLNSHTPIINVPDTYIEYRHYYNLLQRVNNQKKTKNNSADFVFGRVETFFPIKNQNYFNLLVGQGWGIQRCLWRQFNVGGQLGIIEHAYFDKPPSGGFNYIKIEPLIELSICYLFIIHSHKKSL